MYILIKILQLIFCLSILVLAHEFGHFITAKFFKTRVEKFYLFFNPWFSIFKFKKGKTEYGIGWLPLGGYVKIAGMIDESLDKEHLKRSPQPYEFRSKPAWQRLIIMISGVILNIILAISIYVVMLTVWGEQYLPTSEANKYGIICDSLALEMGLKNGDKLLSIDNKTFENFQSFPLEILLNEAKTVQVERDNQFININIPKGFLQKLANKKTADFVFVQIPFEAYKFTENSPGEKAGIQINDKIIGINEKATIYFHEFASEIQKYHNESVDIKIVRENDTIIIPVPISEEGGLGVYTKPINYYFTFAEKKYNIINAIPAGISKTYKNIGDYLKQLRLIFSPEVKAYKNVGSFITIANIFPSIWNWESFWNLTAFLSIMLAILNLLPIPALDGGHTIFLIYEIISRRKPSDKFIEHAQIVGMIILFALMFYAIGNDLFMHVFSLR